MSLFYVINNISVKMRAILPISKIQLIRRVDIIKILKNNNVIWIYDVETNNESDIQSYISDFQ